MEDLPSCPIVWERKVKLFIEKFLHLLNINVLRVAGASNHDNSVGRGKVFVDLVLKFFFELGTFPSKVLQFLQVFLSKEMFHFIKVNHGWLEMLGNFEDFEHDFLDAYFVSEYTH